MGKSEWKPDDRNFILVWPKDTTRNQAEEGCDLIYVFKDYSGGMELPRRGINKFREKRSLKQNRVFGVSTGAAQGAGGLDRVGDISRENSMSPPSLSYLPYHHPLT